MPYERSSNSENISPSTVLLARDMMIYAMDFISATSWMPEEGRREESGVYYHEDLQGGNIDPYLMDLGVEIEDRVVLPVMGQQAKIQRGVTRHTDSAGQPILLLSMAGEGNVLRGSDKDKQWRVSIDGDTGRLVGATKGFEGAGYDTWEALNNQELEGIVLKVREHVIEVI